MRLLIVTVVLLANLSFRAFADLPPCVHTESAGYSYPKPAVQLSVSPTIATTYAHSGAIKYASQAAIAVTPGYEYLSQGPVIKQAVVSSQTYLPPSIATPVVSNTYLPPASIATPVVSNTYLPPTPVVSNAYLPPATVTKTYVPSAYNAISYARPLSKIATYTPTSNIVSVPAVSKVAYGYPNIATKYISSAVSPAISSTYSAGHYGHASPAYTSYSSPVVSQYAVTPTAASLGLHSAGVKYASANLGYAAVSPAPAISKTYVSSPAVSSAYLSNNLGYAAHGYSSLGVANVAAVTPVTKYDSSAPAYSAYGAHSAGVKYASANLGYAAVSPAISKTYVSSPAVSSAYLSNNLGYSAPGYSSLGVSNVAAVAPVTKYVSSAPAVSTSYISSPVVKQIASPLLTRYDASPSYGYASHLGVSNVAAVAPVTKYVSSAPAVSTSYVSSPTVQQIASSYGAYGASPSVGYASHLGTKYVSSPGIATYGSKVAYAGSYAPAVSSSYIPRPVVSAAAYAPAVKQVSYATNPLLGAGIYGTGVHASHLQYAAPAITKQVTYATNPLTAGVVGHGLVSNAGLVSAGHGYYGNGLVGSKIVSNGGLLSAGHGLYSNGIVGSKIVSNGGLVSTGHGIYSDGLVGSKIVSNGGLVSTGHGLYNGLVGSKIVSNGGLVSAGHGIYSNGLVGSKIVSNGGLVSTGHGLYSNGIVGSKIVSNGGLVSSGHGIYSDGLVGSKIVSNGGLVSTDHGLYNGLVGSKIVSNAGLVSTGHGLYSNGLVGSKIVSNGGFISTGHGLYPNGGLVSSAHGYAGHGLVSNGGILGNGLVGSKIVTNGGLVSTGHSYGAGLVSGINANLLATRYAAGVVPSVNQYHTAPVNVVKTVPGAAAIVKSVHSQHDEFYDLHPRYAFEYGVHDPLSGDIKEQKEERDGDVVKGHYSLVEPDGNIRTVNYYADWDTGFHATVTNSRDQISKVIAKRNTQKS